MTTRPGALWRLAAAQGAGTLGDQMFLVALSWVLASEGSAVLLAAVLAVWSVARSVSLLAGGAIVDRLSTRLVSVVAGAVLTVVSACLAVLTSAHDLRPVPWLAAGLVLGMADGVRIPLPTTVAALVVGSSEFARANRVVQSAGWFARALGPVVAGVLTAWAGPGAALWAIAVWYGVALLAWMSVPAVRAKAVTAAPSLVTSLREGVAFVAGHRVLRWLLPVFAADNFFVLGPANVLLPLLVTRSLHGSSAALGILNASYGTGLVVGTVGFGRWPVAVRSSMRASLALFWLADALFACLAFLPSVPAVAAVYGLCGLLIGPASLLYRTYLMHITPPGLMGRVTATTRVTTYGLQPFAQVLAGAAAVAMPVAALFAWAGGLGLAVDGIGWILGRRTPGDLLAVPVEATPAAVR